MKVTVLGCGALGQLWLTALYKHGHEVQAGYASPSHSVASMSLIPTVACLMNHLSLTILIFSPVATCYWSR